METNKEYTATRLNLTGLVKWMNNNYTKQTGNRFTTGDIQQYIAKNRLPIYLGGNEIEIEGGYENIKLYKIVKI